MKAIIQLMIVPLLILTNKPRTDNKDFFAFALLSLWGRKSAHISRFHTRIKAISTTITLKIKAIISGIQLLCVKGYVKYVQPIGLIIDKSTFDTSVPARTI